ncbi:hypothetical protein PtA15_4A479 [Puccinia triticina]|uniref:Uncharacterized protein n=1 Tax=Puccinia triticina TaxID=208348 RepID=A0ABY7CI50_9BASI|nr:uncharacterized protein PtA15_4A479 [Puccinia triticina]WAQ84028.1 hypothetical protein PtA15_4A479 [Puccinia triticina]
MAAAQLGGLPARADQSPLRSLATTLLTQPRLTGDCPLGPTLHPASSVLHGRTLPKVLRARMVTIASFLLRMFHANKYLGTLDGSRDPSS